MLKNSSSIQCIIGVILSTPIPFQHLFSKQIEILIPTILLLAHIFCHSIYLGITSRTSKPQRHTKLCGLLFWGRKRECFKFKCLKERRRGGFRSWVRGFWGAAKRHHFCEDWVCAYTAFWILRRFRKNKAAVGWGKLEANILQGKSTQCQPVESASEYSINDRPLYYSNKLEERLWN